MEEVIKVRDAIEQKVRIFSEVVFVGPLLIGYCSCTTTLLPNSSSEHG